MLHLQKLDIRGIRSFDPDDFQEIKFRPLTLILGQNGAGKTTIIESLKFAATGELPPGCDRGKTFVHDIGLTKETTVNGQIRLTFNDIENKKSVITRSVRTSARNVKQKQTVNFKQVNQRIVRDGNPIDNDQKIDDINSQAIELFGVSKAVLSNVIFCHQEDTNWPLSEGKVLKEKFDSIFGSDEYVKGLEKIKKVRTEKIKNFKHLQSQTSNAYEWMKEAQRFNKELTLEDNRVQDLRTRVTKYKEELKNQKSKLEDLVKKEELIDNHMKDILKIECLSKALKYRIDELESFSLDDDLLSKSLETLSQEVETYHSKNEKLIEQRKNLESEIESLSARNADLSRERKTLSQELGKIDELKRQIEIKKNTRNEIFTFLNNFQSKFSKDSLIDKQVLNTEEKEFVCDFINKEFEKFKISNNKQKIDLQSQFDSVDSQFRNKQNRKSILVHQIQDKKKNLSNLQENLKKFDSISIEQNHESKFQESAQKIQQLKDKICNLNSEAINIKNDRNKFEEQKKTLKIDMISMEKKILALEKKVESNNEAFMQKSIDDKIAQKSEIFDKCSGVKNLVFDENGLLFPSLRYQLNNYQNEIDSYRLKIEQYSKMRNDAMKDMDAYHNLTEQLSEIKSSFIGICDIDEYEKLKDSKEHAMKEFHARKEYLNKIIPALEKQLDQVKFGGYCPVCENDIDSTWTSKKTGETMRHSVVVENLSKTIQDNNRELQTFSIDALENDFQNLKRLGSLFERYQTCKIQMEQSMKNYEIAKERIQEYRNSISKNNDLLEQAKLKFKECEKYCFDVQLHDSLVGEIGLMKTKLKSLNSAKYSVELDEIKVELLEKESILSFVQTEIDRFVSKLDKNSDDKSNTFRLLQDAENDERKLKEQHENHSNYLKFISQIKDLETEIVNLNDELEKILLVLPEISSKFKNLKEQLDNVNFEIQNKKLKVENHLKTFKNCCKEIEECHERLEICYEKNSKSYIEKLENEVDNIEKTIFKCENKLKFIKIELEGSSPRLEMIIRCRDLLKSKEEKSDYDQQIVEIRKKMPSETLSQVRNEKSQLSDIRTKTQARLENTTTLVLECQERVERLKERMEEEKYANAEKNYKTHLAEEYSTKLGCEDLNKYYKAMDSSITQFHISKMDEINKLLEKLWKIAYQSNDIEAIKIVSDEEIRSADTARRNYDYRVVMVKDKKELDMRGRSSAGQKVLACLVIRLVLAIIFCNNFTVVTLDEPTTNLDRKNIRAFSRAIASLIKSDRYFQIIIITHDREFLNCLDSEMIEQYFEVIKNPRGYSEIVSRSTKESTDPFEMTINKNNDKDKDSSLKRKYGDVSLIEAKKIKTEKSQT